MLYILLVDDDELFVELVAETLQREREGDDSCFSVSGATTPAAALMIAQTSSVVFDVLLIDVNLNAEIDGITLMQELQRLHPDSDAIVFTGYDDAETGMRAFEMGVYRYLTKPVSPRELTLNLHRLEQQRSIQRERDWLKVLTDVAEESQRATSKQAVATIIVRGGQRLGFQRVRFWWASADETTLELAAYIGSPELDSFLPIKLPVNDSPYAKAIIRATEAVFFVGNTLGATDLERLLGSDNFKTPVGEWAGVALRSGDRLLALLLLDNQDHPQHYFSEQRKLISLFGQQAAVAIAKAHLFELEQQKSRELEILNQIGQQITSRAAEDLDQLLLDLRDRIGEFVNVSNFMIVLKDEEIQRLDFRLHFEEGRPRQRRWVALDHGLVSCVIATNAPLFLPEGSSAYLKQHGLRRKGRTAQCWLGVPLRVAERAIGVLAVQSYEKSYAFSPDQARFLDAVADTIVGAIRVAWAREKEVDATKRLAVLQRFSAEFMTLAEESPDLFWHAVLTAATADYALRFNRAMLFMRERMSQDLRGVMGIGNFDGKIARKNWEKDKVRGFDYEHYLQSKRSGALQATPVEGTVKAMTLAADFEGSSLQKTLLSAQRMIVTADQVEATLPRIFVQTFGVTDYAIVPLKAGERLLGVVIVDNIHNRYPLSSDYLDQLETVLTQAALVYQNVRQRRIRDVIVDTNYRIVSEAAQTPLKETLEHICAAAAQVTEADNVVIYPLQSDGRYDERSVAATGLKAKKQLVDKPRRGMTVHVLNRGALVVPDVAESPLIFAGKPLRLHAFIQRESVRAFIGVRIKDAITDDAVGAIYLNYCYTRRFDERDRRVADMFAGLAATAIRTTREAESTRADLAEANQLGEASRQELVILQRVLGESLVSDPSEEKLIPVVLRAAHGLLNKPDAQIALLLRAWNPPQQPNEEPKEIQKQYYLTRSGELVATLETNVFRGISGLAMQTGEPQLINDIEQDVRGKYYYSVHGKTKAELDMPIQSGRRVIGALNTESPQVNAFTEGDKAKLDRLAKVTALAFDNVRRQAHLRMLLKAAKAMTSPTGLQETFDAIVQAARSIAPDLSAFTVWYKNPENEQIWLGSYYGVEDVKALKQRPLEPNSVVARIMQRDEPLWAEAAQQASALGNHFVIKERIQSCGAFPLRVDDKAVGAMFFNYRAKHLFSNEEKAVFPLLAELAAVSMRDAALFHVVQQEQARLKHSLEITEAVGTTLNLHQTLIKIMAELRKIFPSAIPCVLLYNEVEQTLEFAPASFEFYGLDNLERARIVSLPLDGLGLAVQTALRSIADWEPTLDIYPSVTDLPNYLPVINSTKAQMNVGLMSREKRLLGVLVLESSKENAFSDADQALVKGIAQQISVAIDRAAESAKLRFKTTVASRTSWATELAHDASREVSYIRNRTYVIADEEHTIEEIRAYANEIDASAERLTKAIQSDVTIAAEEKQLLDIEEAMKGWLKEIVQDKFPAITVHCECHSPEKLVETNREMLRRAIRHVLRNSVEAMERRGKIFCAITTTSSGMMEIRITDTGPGISEEIRQVLGAEPYSTKGENRGHGLLFVRSLLEDMGGTMRIPKSSPDEGAVVILRIPASILNAVAEVS